MKILVIIENNPYWQSDAVANRLLTLVEGLAKHGVKVELFSLYGFTSIDEYRSYQHNNTLNGVTTSYLYPKLFRYKFIMRALRKILPKRTIAKTLVKKIKENNYDYIWPSHTIFIIKTCIKLFEYDLNIKYFHERSEYSWIGIDDKKAHRAYLDVFLKNVDVMAIMTNTLIDYYKTYLRSEVPIIHLPMTVDLERFDLEKSKTQLQQPYIAYCGTMNNKKDGVDILVKAFIAIMDEFPNYYLYLAGPLVPKKDVDAISEIIHLNKASRRIKFLGLVC